MIPLSIDKKGDFVCMNYESNSDYFTIFEHMQNRFYKNRNELLLSCDDESYLKLLNVVKPAHLYYWQSLEYPLRKLLNHFKAIVKVYGDYLITDYYFKGVYLEDEGVHLHYCEFGADDEEFEDWKFNAHLLGKTLNDFVEDLNNQRKLGDIHIKAIKVILLHNKSSKPKRKRTNIPRGLRHEVFKRDGYKCVECGASKEDGATLHVDHIIPVSKGGTDELSNLQTLCRDCNLNKSDVIQ